MNWFTSTAARAAAVALVCTAAIVLPASAQQVQDITPLPAAAPAAQAAAPDAAPAVAPAASPTSETTGPRVRPAIQRVEPVLAGSSSAYSMKKDNMHTITISTVALILLVILVVLLVK